jgi:hypothetical protein
MRLVDYLQGRKDKKTCRICNYNAKNEIELERIEKGTCDIYITRMQINPFFKIHTKLPSYIVFIN